MWFDLKLPSHVIEEVQLSSLQLEAVVYACQQHMNILSDSTRAGYLIGEWGGKESGSEGRQATLLISGMGRGRM